MSNYPEEEYQLLIQALESAGHFGVWQGHSLACVEKRENDRYCGKSFLAFIRKGTWYLNVWGIGDIYQIPDQEQIVTIALHLLKKGMKWSCNIPEEIVVLYELIPFHFDPETGEIGDPVSKSISPADSKSQ